MFFLSLLALGIRFSSLMYANDIDLHDCKSGRLIARIRPIEYKHILENKEYLQTVMKGEYEALQKIEELLDEDSD